MLQKQSDFLTLVDRASREHSIPDERHVLQHETLSPIQRAHMVQELFNDAHHYTGTSGPLTA